MFDSDKINGALAALAIVGLTVLGFRGCGACETNTKAQRDCQSAAFTECIATAGSSDCGINAAIACGADVREGG
jgi:hypothetical protein